MTSLHWEDHMGDLALGWAPAAAWLPELEGRKGAGVKQWGWVTITWGWVVSLPVGTIPLRLRRSPVLRRRTKHESLPEPEGEPGVSLDAAGEIRCSPCFQRLGYRGFLCAHTSTLCRGRTAGLAPCRPRAAAGWSRHCQRAPTKCWECTRLSSCRPKTGLGAASSGTVKPLHATVLFPRKPCKEAHHARGLAAGVQGCSVLGYNIITHLLLWG